MPDSFEEMLERHTQFLRSRTVEELVEKSLRMLHSEESDDPNPHTAYNGADRPAKRDLTSRERDVLCRILDDILYQLKVTRDLNSLMWRDHPAHLAPGGIRMQMQDVSRLF